MYRRLKPGLSSQYPKIYADLSAPLRSLLLRVMILFLISKGNFSIKNNLLKSFQNSAKFHTSVQVKCFTFYCFYEVVDSSLILQSPSWSRILSSVGNCKKQFYLMCIAQVFPEVLPVYFFISRKLHIRLHQCLKIWHFIRLNMPKHFENCFCFLLQMRRQRGIRRWRSREKGVEHSELKGKSFILKSMTQWIKWFNYLRFRFQWPRGVRPVAACMLRVCVRIPPEARMPVCCECCVCCQVEVSATSWSLVQRSPIDCDGSLCVI